MDDRIEFYSNSEEKTADVGKKLAHFARIGDGFALHGTLGMGKSVLARGFIQELTNVKEVPSPTFTLVQLYDADNFSIYHFDLYRLKSPEEIFELGMEEAIYQGVSLIEWPDKMGGYLPQGIFHVTISPEKDGRKITISTSNDSQRLRLLEYFKP